MRSNIRIGTRGSELALWQAHHVKAMLETRFPEQSIEVVIIKTTGDKILDVPLAKIGDKGLFIKELENALLNEHIDLAVHSFKDVPTNIPDGLAITAVLERVDPRDVFISHSKKINQAFLTLPAHAMIATGSLRRKCQLLNARSDLQIVDIRGNLNTRLRKLDESAWDGMILAKAGVTRLGWTQRITEIIPLEIMLPAVGQGALALEARNDDKQIKELLLAFHHLPSALAVNAERSLLRRLEGGCQIPIGAYAAVEGAELRLDAVIGSLDGKRIVKGRRNGAHANGERIGIDLAEELLKRGGKEILDEIRPSGSH
jgi:hydroxymethylbilane synthase